MQGTVRWLDDAMFVGESGSGHSVVMDGPADLGGRNLSLRPMEMLLLGTGGCAIYDVISMLKKSRQNITDCRVELQAERADDVPAVFTHVNLHFVVTGYDLKEPQVRELYCCQRKSTALHQLCLPGRGGGYPQLCHRGVAEMKPIGWRLDPVG